MEDTLSHREAPALLPNSETRQDGAGQGVLELAWSVIPDLSGAEIRPRRDTWPALARLLAAPPEYANKAACPLAKLAAFGTIRTGRGSLRTEANMHTCSGVEGDYDAGCLQPAEAARLLRAAGISCVIVTTASHRPEAPRWRVFAPLLIPCLPADRAAHVGVLNRVLGGVLAPESFVPAQSFYVGRVQGAPFESHVVDGVPCDVAGLFIDPLYPTGDAQAVGAIEPPDVADMAAMCRLIDTARVDAGTVEHLRAALGHLAAARHGASYGDWVSIGHALKPLGDDVGLPLWLDFSAACPDSTTEDEDEKRAGARSKWAALRGDRVSFVSIFKRAQDLGWINPNAGRPLHRVQGGVVGPDGVAGVASDEYENLQDRTDAGNANMLRRLTNGNLRFVAERRLWLWWDGSGWAPDETGALAQRQALLVAKHYLDAAAEIDRRIAESPMDESEQKRAKKALDSLRAWGLRCRSKGALDAMLALASRDARVLVSSDALDRDPWLLGVANGVVDLRTGVLRDAAREDFVTKRSGFAYRAGAEAPRWVQFVAEVTGSPVPAEVDESSGEVRAGTVGRFGARPALAGYLQRVLGYAMTGSTAEQKMFVVVGDGSNGKNILLDTVQAVAGDYWRTIPPEALMVTRYGADAERPSPTAASLAGARAAISSESSDGAKLDVALVKRHTGGGFMTARLMRENSFRFMVTHKLILMTNHRPGLDHMDEAMRGRLHLIPFDRVWNRPGHPERDPALPDGDKGLTAALQAESEGVLAWLVAGAVAYHQSGLEPPAEVLAVTRAYFSEQDDLGRWLEGFTRCDPAEGASASDLHARFGVWTASRGKRPMSLTAFALTLKRRGVQFKKTPSGIFYGLAPFFTL